MSNFNIKGFYQFKQDGKMILQGENLITNMGELFFLNRCINDELKPMKYIVIGTGKSIPLKTDDKLGNEIKRKTPERLIANNDTMSIDLHASFTASDIVGVSEIGVANDKILISHDVFEKIDMSMLSNLVGSVEVTYSFQLSTSTLRTDWLLAPNKIKTFYVREPSKVTGVMEKNTKNGYKNMNSVDDVERNSGSYYYDVLTQILYIHTIEDGNVIVNPNSIDIIVQTK